MAKVKFYGVRKGRKIGVFESWEDTIKYVNKYSGAEYKSFKTHNEAQNYVNSVSKKKKNNIKKQTKQTNNNDKTEVKIKTKEVNKKEVIKSIKKVTEKPKQLEKNKINLEQEQNQLKQKQLFVDYNKEISQVSPSAFIDVYVDGSYQSSTNSIGYGIVFILSNTFMLKDCGRIPTKETSTRNVFGEIYAVIRAIQMAVANDIENIRVHYDYEGLEKWITGEWKSKVPISKYYIEYFNQQVLIDKKVNVIFKKVSAHSGNFGNDIADELAKTGCKL